MRLSVRFLLSLVTGGLLLTLPASQATVHAQTSDQQSPAPAPAPAAPAAPAPAPGENAQPAPAEPAKPVTAPQNPAPVEPPKTEVKVVAPVLKPAGPPPVAPVLMPAGPEAVPDPSKVPVRPAPKTPEAVLPASTDEETRFVELVNKERAKRGLSQLRIDATLILVAREHSAEMRDKAYFNHESPTVGIKTPLDRYLKAVTFRPTYACVGENLFWATVVDIQRGHQAFMNSPTHRENILFPRFEKIGVGIVKDAKGEFWVTQMFLTNTDPVSVAKNKMAR
jgi:uncharacterized protein YkwD